MFHRTRRLVFYRMLLLLLSFCLILTGCHPASDDQPDADQPDADQPLWVVSGGGDGEPASLVWAALSASKSRVAYGEEVEFTVHFRGFENDPWLGCRIGCEIVVRIDDVDSNKAGEEILLKQYEDFSVDFYENHNCNGVMKNHAIATFTFPTDFFTKEEGILVFAVEQTLGGITENPTVKNGCGASVYFVKSEEGIQFYDNDHDYYNREQ